MAVSWHLTCDFSVYIVYTPHPMLLFCQVVCITIFSTIRHEQWYKITFFEKNAKSRVSLGIIDFIVIVYVVIPLESSCCVARFQV